MTDENETTAPNVPPTRDADDKAAVDKVRTLLDAVPERIGPYRLFERLGGGGMGEVFVAEQTTPIKRRVALKLIKTGMDTRQVVARFEAERQALAMMDHPNVARVFDAGTTDAGRPYFVMELIRGVPITQFCDDNKLTTRQRVELMVPVCQAVQHAHQKGVIHRDLKPTNVLVTLHDGKPVPKVIDFGIAKATGPGLTDKTVYTEFRQMIGTPAYMSPEQAEMSGLDIDTRSDVYSLGVLAYELLTGSTPFDTKRLIEAGLAEIGRIIKEEDPPRPSLRLSTMAEASRTTVAAHRGTEPTRIGKLMAGELDWIVMKAMEKDRRRRYETANDLAADLGRHLAGEPIVAAPPSAAYRVRKFARKYRGPVIVSAAFTGTLVTAAVVTTWQFLEANRANKSLVSQVDRTVEAIRNAAIENSSDILFSTENEPTAGRVTLEFEESTGRKLGAVELHRRGRPEQTDLMPDVKLWGSDGRPASGTDAILLLGAFASDVARDGRLQRAELAREKDAAETEAYIANLALAEAAVQGDRWPEARQRLEACPESKRGWEWAFMRKSAQISKFAIPDYWLQLTPDRNFLQNDGQLAWDISDGTRLRLPGLSVGLHWHWSDVKFDPKSGLSAGLQSVSVPGLSDKENYTLRKWNLRTGEAAGQPLSLGEAEDSKLSQDGRFVAIRANSSTVKFIDAQTGKPTGKPVAKIDKYEFGPGTLITIKYVGRDEYQVWDAATSTPVGPIITAKHSICLSDDGTLAVTTANDGTIQILSISTGKIVQTVKLEIPSPDVSLSPDNTLLVAGRTKMGYQLIETRSGFVRGEVSAEELPLISPDGSLMAAGNRLWDTVTARPLGVAIDRRFFDWLFKGFIPQQRAVLLGAYYSEAYSANIVLKIDDFDSAVSRFANERELEATLAFEIGQTGQGRPAKTDVVHDGDPTSRPTHLRQAHATTISPDGKRLVAAYDGNLIRFWDTATWRELVAMPMTTDVSKLRFTPDGTRLILDFADGTMEIWDTRNYAARQKDRDARFDEIPAARAYVQALLASNAAADTSAEMDTLKVAIRKDASISTLRKLVALEQLELEFAKRQAATRPASTQPATLPEATPTTRAASVP